MSKKEDLIASLNEAFKIEKKRKEGKTYRMESMVIDDHVYQRMLDIEDNETMDVSLQVEKQYILGFIRLLRSEKEYVINKSGDILDEKFQAACEANDKEAVIHLFNFVKGYAAKLNMLDENDPKRSVVLVHVANEIAKM